MVYVPQRLHGPSTMTMVDFSSPLLRMLNPPWQFLGSTTLKANIAPDFQRWHHSAPPNQERAPTQNSPNRRSRLQLLINGTV